MIFPCTGNQKQSKRLLAEHFEGLEKEDGEAEEQETDQQQAEEEDEDFDAGSEDELENDQDDPDQHRKVWLLFLLMQCSAIVASGQDPKITHTCLYCKCALHCWLS